MTLTAKDYYYHQLNKEQKKVMSSMRATFFQPGALSRIAFPRRDTSQPISESSFKMCIRDRSCVSLLESETYIHHHPPEIYNPGQRRIPNALNPSDYQQACLLYTSMRCEQGFF